LASLAAVGNWAEEIEGSKAANAMPARRRVVMGLKMKKDYRSIGTNELKG
jgi:hypothetical protein